jgi:hypothetical protein
LNAGNLGGRSKGHGRLRDSSGQLVYRPSFDCGVFGFTAELIHSVFLFFIRKPGYTEAIAKLTYMDTIFTAALLPLFDRKAFCLL